MPENNEATPENTAQDPVSSRSALTNGYFLLDFLHFTPKGDCRDYFQLFSAASLLGGRCRSGSSRSGSTR